MSSRIKLPFKLVDSKKINDFEINETLKKENFSLSEIARYGFPYRPTTLAYDPVQKILAIGTKSGIIKIYGGAFVECTLSHPTEVEIVQLVFRINEGALISACRDNYIHLWNLRQKKPVIANSLRFVKEKISRCLLPLAFNSEWLLVGTHLGNVYVVNLDTFSLSSYKIMWNNAIGMGKSKHPGVIVDLSQNPGDPTRLYIGFSTHLDSSTNVPVGHVICWNLQQKTSESVYTLQNGLTSVSWHYEGRQFMCSHCDGSLSIWNLRTTSKPVSINYPHVRIAKDESYRFGTVPRVVWSSIKNSNETLAIFSGGMPPQTDSQSISSGNATLVTSSRSKPSSHFLTMIRGQTTNVLHMDNAIIDFHVITPSPHLADEPDPSAVVVLLENDLVLIDLKTDNYPLFESLHTTDLHESPVTYCSYITEPSTNFYQHLLRLQSKQIPKRTYSKQENPILGGKPGSTIFGYNELIITGHVDGSIKFWDASGCNLLFLYKLRTNRLFDLIQSSNQLSPSSQEMNTNIKSNTRTALASSNACDEQIQQQLNSFHLSNELNGYENPFAIYLIKICCDGKYLVVAASGGHITLFKFAGSELDKVDEGLGDLSCLEVPIFHRNLLNTYNDNNSSVNMTANNESQAAIAKQLLDRKEFKSLLRAKMGYRRAAGYQPELVCLLSWLPSDKIPVLTDMAINPKYGLLIFGLENGVVVIDYFSKFILMNMPTVDLYGTMDPFQRTVMSPKRRGPSNDFYNDNLIFTDYQQQPLTPSSCSTEGGSPSHITTFNDIWRRAPETYLESSNQSVSRNKPRKVVSKELIRSKSIDSTSADNQTLGSHSTGSRPTGSDFHEDRPQSTATLAKRLRTLQLRFSRASTIVKYDTTASHVGQNEKGNAVKTGGNDSEANSTGEEYNQSPFAEAPRYNPDLTKVDPTPITTARSSKAHQLSPLETPSLRATLSALDSVNVNVKNDDNRNSNEKSSLSKTWTSSAFTGASLHGTCSLEYTEHMRDKFHKRKSYVIDLRKDNSQNHHYHQQQQQITTTTITSTNKPSPIDLPQSGGASNMDSVISNESVCAIQFSETFTYRNDFTLSPSVWLGTSAGCVLVINLNITYDPRNISVVPSGSVFRLCGRLLHISFLDHKGIIIRPPDEKWENGKTKVNRLADGTQDFNTSSILTSSNLTSSSVTSTPPNGTQYAVFCSSKQARVVSLPSQACISKIQIHDSLSASGFSVCRAVVVKIAGSPCLACYSTGGHIHIYSLPSLRELFVTNIDIVTDSFKSFIASTFTFTDRGHGLFMCSPTEIQKLSIDSDVKEQVSEMLCDLYSPSVALPEAPKQNFFAKIFSSNSIINPDRLFGEVAGKAPYGIVQKEDVNMNMTRVRGTVDSSTDVISDTRNKLIERGQKLAELDTASKQLSEGAQEFATLSRKAMIKQKEKAEWWPFTPKKS